MAKRCFGCMKQKETSPVCEHCGYNENVPNYSHQLPIGTVLQGRYSIGKVLGQGGFGITYIGWDQSLQAAVAIKEYYPNSYVNRDCAQTLDVICAGDGAAELFRYNRERFLREARILAKLQNVPGIVRVQNLFAENNTAYIVMEYVEGIDLKRYIRLQNRVLTVEETFSILRPVMYALSKVHDAELVHRDISPDNIMILPDGTAKLLDFGAAREVENAEVDKELPQSTEAILKHGFAPIEQYRRRGSLGPWTDVYALCATMYYCLTGKVPNSAPERITEDDNVNWRSIPGLTERQMAALEKGMTIMPKDRTRSMGELHRGLFSHTKQTADAPTSQKPVDYPTNTVPLEETSGVMETKKKKKPVAAIAAAVLAIAAAVGLFALKPKAEDNTVSVPEILPTVTETVEGTEPVVLTQEQLQYLEAEGLEEAKEYGKAAIAFGKLGDYADARERSFAIWEKITCRETFPTNWTKHDNRWDKAFIALKNDGTVLSAFPPVDAVTEWTDIVAIETCSYPDGSFVLGLKKDGTVVTTIVNNEHTEFDTSHWTDIVAIDARNGTAVGLRADGTVVAIGASNFLGDSGQQDVKDWTDIISVHTTGSCTIGLKADGSVVACGEGAEYVSGWTDIASISTSGSVIGLKTDGTIVTTDADLSGEWDVTGWTDIVAVDTGYWGSHLVGLRSDGTVVAIGSDNSYNKIQVSDWTDIIEVYTTDSYTIGLKSDGTVVSSGLNIDGCLNVETWTDIAAIRVWYGCTVGLKSDGTVVFAGKGHAAMNNWADIKLPTQPLPARSGGETTPDSPSGEEVITKNRLMSDRGPSAITGNEWEYFPTYTVLGSDIKRNKIMSVTFVKTLKDAPEDAWDVSENLDGSVLAWVEKSADNYNYYDLFIGADGTITAPENCSYLFAGYSNARSIAFNDVLDTGSTTSMSNMFYGCTRLTELDVGSFDTGNVTDMSYMFCVCEQLWSINLRNFDTSKVTDMSGMFSACQNLNGIDVSSFDTSNVTDMSYMFTRLSVLQTLDLQHFDTSKVTDMGWMFSECNKLWNLKVGNWETDSVVNYEFFFFPDRKIEGQRWQDWFENRE